MIRLILLLISLLLVSGCSTVRVSTPDCTASYTRVWFEQEGFSANICGGQAAVAKTSNNLDILKDLLPLLKGAGVP